MEMTGSPRRFEGLRAAAGLLAGASTLTCGKPTSAPSGGGSGGANRPGSAAAATAAAASAAATFPSPFHRIRIAPTRPPRHGARPSLPPGAQAT